MSLPEHTEPPQGRSAAPAVEGISAVTLATHDMARAVRFYHALGFAIRSGGTSPCFPLLAAALASASWLIPRKT